MPERTVARLSLLVNEPFEVLEHTADIGFRAWGEDPARLFENAGRAMMAIAADLEGVAARVEHAVALDGADYEDLLVNWLSEILYLFDSDRLAPCAFHVDAIEPVALTGRIAGEPREPRRHRWKLIVKAVTYHQLSVSEKQGRWEAQVFLDI